MSKASGILLIALGVGVAVYVMPSYTEEAGKQAQEMAAAEAAVTEVVSVATVERPEAIVAPRPQPAVRPAKVAARVAPKDTSGIGPGRPMVVTVPQRAREASASVHPEMKAPIILPGDRVGLTRELQRELRRVGCYEGAIDGTWSQTARRAMKVFTDRVNASLPIDEPDYILLRLVQGSQEQVCGASCPTGQGLSRDGRCLPNAVIARASKKPTTPGLPAPATKSAAAEAPVVATSGWATTATVTTQNLPETPEGRMALAGPTQPAQIRPLPRDDRASLGALVQTPDSQASRMAEVGPASRKSLERTRQKPAAVENRASRQVSAPRKKFGVWFFRQQDTWNN